MKYSYYLSRLYRINDIAQVFIAPLTLFAMRGYLFKTFFLAGLTKLRDWESTLFLFEYEYSVPLLSPQFAAYFGTAAELILPCLLLSGFLTPIAALGLFIFNIVAISSLSELPFAALLLHIIWGGLIFILLIWGPGKLSVDAIIRYNINDR